MKEGYYITSDGVRHTIKSKRVPILTDMDLIELVLPDGVRDIYCYENQLTKLHLQDGVECVYCENNNLTELILPKSVVSVWCYSNQIKELTIPDSVERVNCDNIDIPNLGRFLNNENVIINIYI